MTENKDLNFHKKDNEISIGELFNKLKIWFFFFKSKWLIVLMATLLGASFGYYYAFTQKPTYNASLSFALEDEKSGGGGITGALGLASSLGIDLGSSAGGAFSGANLIELMKSRTLIERALLNPVSINGKSITLAEYFIEFTKMREALNSKSSLMNIHYSLNDKRSNFSLQKDSILGEIYKNIINGVLSVYQKDKKISIINVDVKTENEIFSKTLSESVVKVVSEFYIDTKSKKAKNNVAILQKQTDSIRNELNSAISGVAQASDNTFNLNTAFNIKRVSSTRRQVDVQANTAILTQLVTNLEMAKVTLLKETPLIQIIDLPILPLTKYKLSKVKSIAIGMLLSLLTSMTILIFLKLLSEERT